MDFKRVKIATTVPRANANDVRHALGEAGAGKLGNYTFCSFSMIGTGRFIPGDQATPHIGSVNKPTSVEEEYIEVQCDRSIAKQVVAALKQAHPYEEVMINITPLIDEDQL